ncbi:MAG: ribonuclease HII [Lentisphaeraceae bacterium]|nr:ribonuclease HII [Lentisphaeraceae bacterium]
MKQPELFPGNEEGPYFFEDEAVKQGCFFIAGVDEAGRGPLAGPVVAGAVIIDRSKTPLPEGIDDSKKLTPAKRAKLFIELQSHPAITWAVGIVDAKEIDSINILNATHLAMKKAVEALELKADHCLVDGLPIKGLSVDHTAIVKGDSRSASIGAASIFAKETRDQMMIDYDQKYPGYGFAKHKGYGTKVHTEALDRIGPCPIHRFSFSPVTKAAAKHK